MYRHYVQFFQFGYNQVINAGTGRQWLLQLITLSHTQTHEHKQSVGLPWTMDRFVEGCLPEQHKIITRDTHPCSWRYSHCYSQQESCRKPYTFDRAATVIGHCEQQYEKTFLIKVQRTVTEVLQVYGHSVHAVMFFFCVSLWVCVCVCVCVCVSII